MSKSAFVFNFILIFLFFLIQWLDQGWPMVIRQHFCGLVM